MHHQSLRILAILFVALVVLQSLLGGVLFVVVAGWNPHDIAHYYAQKSLHGALEVLAPHVLFVSIALMGSLHFLGFIKTISDKQQQFFIHGLFVLFGLDQSAPLMIMAGFESFVWVKIVAFVLFETLLAWLLIAIFRGSVSDFLTHRLGEQN